MHVGGDHERPRTRHQSGPIGLRPTRAGRRAGRRRRRGRCRLRGHQRNRPAPGHRPPLHQPADPRFQWRPGHADLRRLGHLLHAGRRDGGLQRLGRGARTAIPGTGAGGATALRQGRRQPIPGGTRHRGRLRADTRRHDRLLLRRLRPEPGTRRARRATRQPRDHPPPQSMRMGSCRATIRTQ